MKSAVTASTQEAADAGVEVLQRGGNAVDAIVAAALATCVADPCNTGLGGYGGYLLVQHPGETARCVAFPVWPPSSMSPAELVRSCPESGPSCSTVPNVVGGLAAALDEFGTVSWAAASAGAIRLARDGVVANKTTSRAFSLHRQRSFIAECFDFNESAGLVFRQPRLAATLERMATDGPHWFYWGPLAEAATAAWATAGIDIPIADWKEQPKKVFIEDAAQHTVNGVRIHAAPLGLSGSACMFAFVDAASRICSRGALEKPHILAALGAAMARVWQHRFAMPSGNDFSDISIDAWIDAALLHDGATASPAPAPAVEHTAHLNAVDESGMLASLTFTHGPAWFGGRWAIPGTGVIMNAGMHNFARTGTVPRGGRRYGVSNMCPTIAECDAGTRLALGCPGSRRIPSNVALALARFVFGDSSLQASVSAGRFHGESAGCAYVETERLGADVIKAFANRFDDVQPESTENYFGPLTAISRDEFGKVEVGIDDRELPGFSAASTESQSRKIEK